MFPGEKYMKVLQDNLGIDKTWAFPAQKRKAKVSKRRVIQCVFNLNNWLFLGKMGSVFATVQGYWLSITSDNFNCFIWKVLSNTETVTKLHSVLWEITLHVFDSHLAGVTTVVCNVRLDPVQSRLLVIQSPVAAFNRLEEAERTCRRQRIRHLLDLLNFRHALLFFYVWNCSWLLRFS